MEIVELLRLQKFLEKKNSEGKLNNDQKTLLEELDFLLKEIDDSDNISLSESVTLCKDDVCPYCNRPW